MATRKFKVISIDNGSNSHPVALSRVSELAKDLLPANPSKDDVESTLVDSFKADLRDEAEVRSIFERYGKGGIWGVIHIAVSAHDNYLYFIS
jgi:UDP-glucose 4-epimerase